MCVLIYLRVFSRGLICGATPLSKVSKPVLSQPARALARPRKGNADAAKRLSSALAGSLISRRTGAAEALKPPTVVTHPHAWIYLAIYAAFVVYVILDAIPGIVPGPASR